MSKKTELTASEISRHAIEDGRGLKGKPRSSGRFVRKIPHLPGILAESRYPVDSGETDFHQGEASEIVKVVD